MLRSETKEVLAASKAFLDESAELDLEERINQVLNSAAAGLHDCNCAYDKAGRRCCEISLFNLPLTGLSSTYYSYWRNPDTFPDLYGDWVSVPQLDYENQLCDLENQIGMEYRRHLERDIHG